MRFLGQVDPDGRDWFVIWFESSLIWDSEPLLFDPVNWWTGTLLLAIALDLASLHASPVGRAKKAGRAARRAARWGSSSGP